MTKSLTYVEVDVDRCSLDFGVSPCTAAVGSGYPTGGLKAGVFDGYTVATRGAGLTGAADSKLFTFAVVLRRRDHTFNTQVLFAGAANPGSGSVRGVGVHFERQSGGGGKLVVQGRNSAGTVILLVESSTIALSNDLITIVGSFDLSDAGKRWLYVNGASDLATVTTYTDDTIDFTVGEWSLCGSSDNDDRSMSWQDITIAAVQFGFVAALVPAVRTRGGKPPTATSLPTAAGLFIIAFTMATLGLWLSTATAAASGAMWLTLAIQRRRAEGRR